LITKDEETKLVKKEQPNEILNVFRAIYIVINESYDGILPNSLIENLINKILPKLKVENLSK